MVLLLQMELHIVKVLVPFLIIVVFHHFLILIAFSVHFLNLDIPLLHLVQLLRYDEVFLLHNLQLVDLLAMNCLQITQFGRDLPELVVHGHQLLAELRYLLIQGCMVSKWLDDFHEGLNLLLVCVDFQGTTASYL